MHIFDYKCYANTEEFETKKCKVQLIFMLATVNNKIVSMWIFCSKYREKEDDKCWNKDCHKVKWDRCEKLKLKIICTVCQKKTRISWIITVKAYNLESTE